MKEMTYRCERTPPSTFDRSLDMPMASENSVVRSESMRTLPSHPCALPHSAITNGSLHAAHKTDHERQSSSWKSGALAYLVAKQNNVPERQDLL